MARYINLFSILGYKLYDAVGTPPNVHHGYQMFYVLDGKIVYVIAGKEYLLTKGECVIVPPFALHGLVSGFGQEPTILDVQFAVQDVAFDKKMRRISEVIHAADPSFAALVEIIVTEARKRHGHFYDAAQNLIETMVLAMIDKGEPEAMGEEMPPEIAFEQYSECTKRAIRYLEGFVSGNYDFNLERVARALGYNKQYLCKTFTHDVGMSIKHYLMMMRIEKAKELIDHTDYMLKDIAEMLRFTSYVYFERMFKLHAGMTPQAYRNLEKGRMQYFKYSFWDAFGNE